MLKDIIDSKKIQKIANLAKIEVLKDEEPHLIEQLNNIINWFDKLNEINVDNVEPLMNVNEMNLEMFQDEISRNDTQEDVLKNAPNANYNYFTVPKVIE